jgi:hypothetical protein
VCDDAGLICPASNSNLCESCCDIECRESCTVTCLHARRRFKCTKVHGLCANVLLFYSPGDQSSGDCLLS